MSASSHGGGPQLGAVEVLLDHGCLDQAEATVCITLFNYEGFVIEALESAFVQTLEPIGLVVLDDCSTDGGLARVERWLGFHGHRFAGARLVRHRRNQGLARARNGAIAQCSSDAVMILDADNQLYARCVERLLRSLEGSPYGFAYCMLEQFGGRAGLVSRFGWSAEMLRQGNYVDAMALIRKATWLEVGGYARMGVGGWEDYDFWCKCVELGIEGLFVPEILARYRVHETSMLRTTTNVEKNVKRVREEMMQRHPWLDC